MVTMVTMFEPYTRKCPFFEKHNMWRDRDHHHHRHHRHLFGELTLELTWIETSRYSQRAQTGHRVSAARGVSTWIYSAWGPDQAPGVHYHDVTAALGGREHYAIGQQVPQRFPWLGDFPTSAEAKAACEADAARTDSAERAA